MKPAELHPLTAALQIARWEFRRYFKLKQQLLGLVIMIVLGGVVFGVMRLSAGSPASVAHVAVLAPPGMSLPEEAAGVRFLARADDTPTSLLEALERREIDGLLQLNADFSGELTLQREREWIADVREVLSMLRRDAARENARIEASVLEEVLAPAALDVVVRDGGSGRRIYSFIIAGVLMMIVIMAALGTIFASITGEKQIRVTEQVLSAIPPQTWMDGKILGVTAVSLASVFITASGFLLLALGLRLAGIGFPLPLALADNGTLIYLALFALMGVFFWLSFLAAIAAIIDDPQTSPRGGFMMIPMLSSGLAFFGIANPDSTLLRMLSLFPPSAPTAMPARLILSEVHWFEPVLALVLLAAAAWLMRLAAGRIFRTAMLMYGKEPSWREIRRWVMER